MKTEPKDSFILYTKYRGQFELLTAKERGELIMAIFEYAETGKLPNFDGSVGMAFSFIRTDMDKNTKKWQETCKKRAAAGSKGGRQSAAKRANASQAKQSKQNTANQAECEYEPEGEYEHDFLLDDEDEARAREYAQTEELYEHVFSISLKEGQRKELYRLVKRYGDDEVTEAIEDVKARNIRDPLMYLGRYLKNHSAET